MTAPLPDADPATRAFFEDWLERFAAHVRRAEYDAALPLWHPEAVLFGTHADLAQGREELARAQWRVVWPRIADFRFNVEMARILSSDDDSMAVVIATWTSTGFDRDGAAFERPGRATLVFHRPPGEDGRERWQCVHSHLSLCRGVPQESHGPAPEAGQRRAGA